MNYKCRFVKNHVVLRIMISQIYRIATINTSSTFLKKHVTCGKQNDECTYNRAMSSEMSNDNTSRNKLICTTYDMDSARCVQQSHNMEIRYWNFTGYTRCAIEPKSRGSCIPSIYRERFIRNVFWNMIMRTYFFKS